MAHPSLLVVPGMMSELKCEKREKFGALEERVGKLGRSSAWIGSLWNSSLELLPLNTPADSLPNKNVRLSTEMKG